MIDDVAIDVFIDSMDHRHHLLIDASMGPLIDTSSFIDHRWLDRYAARCV